jgi:hypothetical protein
LFDDLAVGKRRGRWVIISPIVTHRVVATGR